MSNYQQVTDFSDKDALPTGTAAKKVKGVDFDGEFSAISVAIASKADTTGTDNLTAADITATGNLTAVGITATGNLAAVGITATGNLAAVGITATGVTATDTLVVDKDANGILTDFKIAGATCGSVVASAGTFPSIAIGSGDVGFIFQNSSTADSIRPWDITGNQSRSGQIDLGANGSYWDDIYAINGTINTSDRNQKQSIEELTEAETRVAQTCKGLIRKFKWNSAVDKKGVDGARYHFGVIAQDLQAAFAAEGLDVGDYGLFVSSTWTDEDGVEQTSLGVRYTELLAFIIGGLV